MDFAQFAWTAILGFLAGTGGFAVLAYLSRESLSHWLAKALTDYAATVETREHSRRFRFEALHARRVAAAEGFAAAQAELVTLITFPPEPADPRARSADQPGPELAHQAHWYRIQTAAYALSKLAARESAWFETPDVPAAAHRLAQEAVGLNDRYWDALHDESTSLAHWDQSIEERGTAMMRAHSASLGQNVVLAPHVKRLNTLLRDVVTEKAT